MKTIISSIVVILGTTALCLAQPDYYDVNPGNGHGIRFWSNNTYKIDMGVGPDYRYGPITYNSYSIKMNMPNEPGWGWTWGSPGIVPVAALNAQGQMQISGSFTAKNLNAEDPEPLGDNAGDFKLLTSESGRTYNWLTHNQWLYRDKAGPANWTNSRLHDAISIDFYAFMQPGVDTKTWWERDPFENIQSWGNANQTYMTLKNGALGIGTTDPGSFKLAVNGKIWSQEVNVAMTNPGPDYVFEKDYDLLSLSELETYINQNKHLPEVPSAKEMEAEGLNLKEMNLLLLKKVEELTLHLIEMKKENEIQQIEINALKKN
jgi:hypothetical protein